MLFKIFKVENKMKKLWLHVPKFNYCDMRRRTGAIPIVSDFFKVILQSGNLLGMCPFKIGEYNIKGFAVQQPTMQPFFSYGSYWVAIQLLEENRKSTNIVIFDYKFDRN
jgi:hypothetical protein